MTNENLTFYEPTEEQLAKFRNINSMFSDEWERDCAHCNDCSWCNMAIHKYLLSTVKHICTYGMTEEKFRIEMSDDCEY